MDGLKSEKGKVAVRAWEGGLAPELGPTAHSPCGVLLQAKASGHIHHITGVLRTPVAQGDLGEESRATYSFRARPCFLHPPQECSLERLLGLLIPLGPPPRALPDKSGRALKGDVGRIEDTTGRPLVALPKADRLCRWPGLTPITSRTPAHCPAVLGQSTWEITAAVLYNWAPR